MISFGNWYAPEYSEAAAKFLYEEPVIEMKPAELGYYEHRIGWNYCEEVDFSELFPIAGFYSFDKEGVVKFNWNSEKLYYREKQICSINQTGIIKCWAEKDSMFKSGVSKLYRRGFLDKEVRYKWINELKDILVF